MTILQSGGAAYGRWDAAMVVEHSQYDTKYR